MSPVRTLPEARKPKSGKSGGARISPAPKKARGREARGGEARNGRLSSSDPLRKYPPVVIESVSPEIDGGLFAAKGVAGEPFTVEADIFKEGHDILGANILYRQRDSRDWLEAPMRPVENDRWKGTFIPEKNALYDYTVEAWMDPMASWVRFMKKKCPAEVNVRSDLEEGLHDLREMEKAAQGEDRKKIRGLYKQLSLSDGASDEVLKILDSADFTRMTLRYVLKRRLTRYGRELALMADRREAAFSAWYEMFPRSQGKSEEKSGTFRDCISRLPDIRRMGFDVVYFPPIHPIGVTERKGPNNTLGAGPDAHGSPWAIGGREGGHKAIHPHLGSMKDFRDLVREAGRLGMEIALDLAYQCSPDHPYVREHPDWFYRLPDGTIRYAENPPKKYQDIYPLDFYCEDREALWEELKSVIFFWIDKGVKIFRVDNPHTKPLRFWQWVIGEVKNEHPDVIFLSEAFTRPKVMKFLAKAGFTQSYTYFTWRNTKWELQQYLEELTRTDMRHYFRANFFANTPDILHEYLQKGGRPAFQTRLVLASTLSPVYGIYSGYEFCENTPLHEGSEEYLDSEKYQIRPRDWHHPENIKDYIAQINHIRHDNPALHEYTNLKFFHSNNGQILCYGKKTADNSNIIVVVVNLDPRHTQEDTVSLPIWEFGIEPWQTYQMKDLITGEKYYWKGEHNYVRLDPASQPAHIFRLKK